MALVQSNHGGYAARTSFVVSASTFYLTTSAVGFSSPTTAGNLLILATWMTATVAGTATVEVAVTGSPTPLGTSTWVAVDSGLNCLNCAGLYYLKGAPSIPTIDTSTVVGEFINSTYTVALAAVEFALFEFNGVQNANYDAQSGAAGANSTPTVGVFSGHPNDLAFCNYIAPGGSTLAAGPGYTLGISPATLLFGQTQYMLTTTTNVTTAFGGAQAGTWFSSAGLFHNATATAGAAFAYGFPTLIM